MRARQPRIDQRPSDPHAGARWAFVISAAMAVVSGVVYAVLTLSGGEGVSGAGRAGVTGGGSGGVVAPRGELPRFEGAASVAD